MPRRPILFVLLLALLAAGAVRAEEPRQPASEPEKKPDAFQYFFGPKEEKGKVEEANEEEVGLPEILPTVETPRGASPSPEVPAASDGSLDVDGAAAGDAPRGVSTVGDTPMAVAPPRSGEGGTGEGREKQGRLDAFQYFFGRGAQPQAKEEKKEEQPEAGPVKKGSAFEYFFGEKRGEKKKETAESEPPR